MNRNQAKELLPILQAFAEGKVIQVKNNNVWKDIDNNHNCVFLPDSYEYRIKSEPKYRPFKNATECWKELLKHQPFGWVKDKEDGHLVLITEIDRTGNISLLCNGGWDLDGIKDNFTFADGTPFGLEEEQL